VVVTKPLTHGKSDFEEEDSRRPRGDKNGTGEKRGLKRKNAEKGSKAWGGVYENTGKRSRRGPGRKRRRKSLRPECETYI